MPGWGMAAGGAVATPALRFPQTSGGGVDALLCPQGHARGATDPGPGPSPARDRDPPNLSKTAETLRGPNQSQSREAAFRPA